MDKLLPCPFCGAEAFIWAAYGGYKVSCKNSCVTMPSRHDVSFTLEEDAIKCWNKERYEWDDEHRRLDKIIYEKEEEIKGLRKELGRLREMTQTFR